MSDSNRTADIVGAGITGAVLFLVFLLLIDTGILLSLGIGAVGFIAGLLLFTRKKAAVIDKEHELKSALDDGARKLQDIRNIEKKIKDDSVIRKIKGIDEVTAKILAEIKKDPSILSDARQFLKYYLDSTVKILEKYVELGSQNINDASIGNSLAKVEGILGDLQAAFEKQLAGLLAHDVMDLDAELNLLQQTIKMEGLGK